MEKVERRSTDLEEKAKRSAPPTLRPQLGRRHTPCGDSGTPGGEEACGKRGEGGLRSGQSEDRGPVGKNTGGTAEATKRSRRSRAERGRAEDSRALAQKAVPECTLSG